MRVQPDGVNVRITDQGLLAVEFDHDDVPVIVMDYESAQHVGSALASSSYKAEQLARKQNHEG